MKHQAPDTSKPIARGVYAKRGLRYSLRLLREAVGMTQAEIAKAAEMSQGEISRLENREDFLHSTLEKYAHALGGKLRTTIEVNGRAYEISFDRPTEHG